MHVLSIKATTLLFIVLTIITATIYYKKKNITPNTKKLSKKLLYVFAIITLFQATQIHYTANTFKPNEKIFNTLSLFKLLQLNSKSIKTKEPNSIEKGQLIVIVKYGCKDCNTVKKDMLKYIKDQNIKDIYFVSNESKIGKELITKANISQLPTLVYVRNNSIAKDIDLNHTIVYTIDDKGKTVFDEPAFSRMLNRQLNKE